MKSGSAQIWVCPLAELENTVRISGARHIVSLTSPDMHVETPEPVSAENHLRLHFNDISEPRDGLKTPGKSDIERFLAFIQQNWKKDAPLVIHCWFGVSRSTAGALIAACALSPSVQPDAHARKLREIAPFATPNQMMAHLADRQLSLSGSLLEAVIDMGMGQECSSGTPFKWDIDPD
jgi:predicted protein tyrosine phosphatase